MVNVNQALSIRGAYERDGFVLVPQTGLPGDLVGRAAKGLEDVRDGKYDTEYRPEKGSWAPGGAVDRLVKIEHPQLGSKALRDVIGHEAIGRLALEVTGAEWVQVWWVQGLIKPSAAAGVKLASNVGWHQDMQYWKEWSKESELFTLWLALSDVPSEAGPMKFAAGSHKWGLLDQGDFFAQDEKGTRGGIRVPEGERWEEVEAVLPRGGMSFHHRYTFHGSGSNTAGFSRMSLALHMRTEKSGIAEGKSDPWVNKWVNDAEVCPIWRR